MTDAGAEPEIRSGRDYRRLREGLCPVHGTALERQDGRGWCDGCGVGWSLEPGVVSLHFDGVELNFAESGVRPGDSRFRTGPSNVKFSFAVDELPHDWVT